MPNRGDIQDFFEALGITNTYFQPPTNVQISYPAVIYSLINVDQCRANNGIYGICPRYTATYITKDPDDSVILLLTTYPQIRFDRHYCSENLHHYVYSIY